MTWRALLTDTGMRARALRGTLITGGGFAGQNALRLLSNLILTRLLFPEAFGLMALVQVVFAGVAMLSDLGLRSSIVQDARGGERAFLDTAWTMQIIRGAILWSAICLVAAPVAEFYREPLLRDLLIVTGAGIFIKGFGSTAIAHAEREVMQGRITALTLGSQILGLIVTITLAYLMRSVWALVIGQVLSTVFYVAGSHLVMPGPRNRLALERDAVGRIIRFGAWIFLASVAGFLIQQADRAILGRVVSLSDLALYNIAWFLASVPILLGNAVMSRVLFPVYARRPPWESASNRRQIARGRRVMTGGLIAGLTVFALIGVPLVTFLYDPRYEAAGPILVLLAMALMPSAITISYTNLSLSAGHSGRFAILLICLALLQTSLMLVAASRYGIAGVALTPALAQILYYPILVALTRRYESWDPLHDAVYFALALAIAAAAFWVNADALLPLLGA